MEEKRKEVRGKGRNVVGKRGEESRLEIHMGK